MSNLFAQNWFIAKRQALLWILVIFFFAAAALNTLEYGDGFSLTAGIGLALAAIAALFISDQGTSGRLAAEITGGFSRAQIWLSNFLLVLFLGLLLLLSAILGDLAASALKGSLGNISGSGFLLFLAGVILNTGSYAAIYTMILMCVAGRRIGRGLIGLLLCIAVFLCFAVWGAALTERLNEPEFLTYYEYRDGESEITVYGTDPRIDAQIPDELRKHMQRNSRYIHEPLRTQYGQTLQFLPLTQAFFLAEIAFIDPRNDAGIGCRASTMWLDAGMIIAGCTAAGLLLFRRRDLD